MAREHSLLDWIYKLSMRGKIAAICSLLVLPMIVAVYWIVNGYSQDLNAARLEQSGNAFERPLVRLLELLPLHQALAGKYVGGRTDLHDQLVQAQGQIDEALRALGQANQRFGVQLQFTSEGLAKRKREHYRFETLRSEWETLKQQLETLSADAVGRQHLHLILDVRTMITHAGDTSGLILDPDLDSYYLMDATLVGLPQTQDRLASLQSIGEKLLNGRMMSDSERVEFAVQAALLKEADLDRNAGDLETSLNEDQNFYGVSETLQRNLPPAAKEYADANGALLALMKKIGDSGASAVAPAEFSDAAARARNASFRLWDVAVRELDVLLDKRIEHYVQLRWRAVIVPLLTLLLSCLVAYFVTRQIIEVLERVMQRLGQQAGGVASAASQISSSSQSLAQGASEQAASLEQTAESTEEITSVSRKNAENSELATRVVGDVDQQVKEGNQTLQQMVGSMRKINGSSDRISKIIKVIDEIAFQTNILALNAAVEAARAGEAGLGFAVVADEVRNLAHRSARSAKDTAELIEQVHRRIERRQLDSAESGVRDWRNNYQRSQDEDPCR